MNENEREIYAQIGQRISAIRKARGITQVELAQTLGLSKHLLCCYEKGRRRIPAGTLLKAAKHLEVSADEIMGIKRLSVDGRNTNVKLMRRFQRVAALPEEKRRKMVTVIDTFLSEAE